MKAKRKFHIPCETLHKHWRYFYYPETVEAMDYLYDSLPETIGMGTMFRFNNLKYANNKSSAESYIVQHPDVSVPFWFPFKMVVTTTDQHKPLRGWDITHLMEPDPSLIDLVFENSAGLPGGVYMLGFHPAHARRPTFNPGGNYAWFLYAVNGAKKRGWWIVNYKTVCRRLNDWENLNFRIVEDGLIALENPTDSEIYDVVIGCGKGAIKSLAGKNNGITFSNTRLNIASIKPQSTMEIRYRLES